MSLITCLHKVWAFQRTCFALANAGHRRAEHQDQKLEGSPDGRTVFEEGHH